MASTTTPTTPLSSHTALVHSSRRGDLLYQGAEARVYKGRWLDRDVIIKHRFCKRYRHATLDAHLTKERMKAEARALTRCRMAGIRTPCVYDVDFVTQEIVMERIGNAETVRNLIYHYAAEGKCPPKIECPLDDANSLHPVMKSLAEKIGKVLRKMHKNNIIHGDLTTSNMMQVRPYENSDVFLIDFGLSSVEEKVEDKAVDLYVLERAILSTHPNTDIFVRTLLAAYQVNPDNITKNVIKKLDEVRMRGRKKLCFG